jgi:pyochelin biosynthesis protein PchC
VIVQVTSPWLRQFRRTGAGQTVVCFPHAGGAASYFSSWSRHLGPAAGLAVVQYPGRADRAGEPCVEDIGVMADRITEALAMVHGSIVLFGHSLGAAIAHEVAVRIQHAGSHAGQHARPPHVGPLAGLVVSAHPGPGDLEPVTEHLLPDDELWESIRLLNGTHQSVLAEHQFQDLLLPVFRSDFRLAATYRPQVRRALSVPVVACVGDNDPEVTPERMMSWRHATTGPFTLHVFPGGDHFYINGAAGAVSATLSRLFPEPTWPSMP